MRKSDRPSGLTYRRVQSLESGMVARYRPLIANLNNNNSNDTTSNTATTNTTATANKKRVSDTANTARGNSATIKDRLFSRQVNQRGIDQQTQQQQQNLSVTKKSGASSSVNVHTKSGSFEWISYLKEVDADPVQSSVFFHVPFEVQIPSPSILPAQHAIPDGNFEPGQYLEGIDPHNESLICVLCVAELVGRRVKLHFVGYPEKYDFWTTVDSPFLFPVGWCAHNSRQLQPPKEYLDAPSYHPFNWTSYLAKHGGKPVPRHLFRVSWDSPIDASPSHMFAVGLKLEAIDKRNPALACVATIKDCIGDYVLIHFDGWDSGFDQWAHVSSELLHPVGYCENHDQVLSIPSDWSNRRNGFNWKLYLKETNSNPVPKEAFDEATKFAKSSQHFQVNQRLEAVDKRCPSLIRVANVVDNTPPGFLTLGYDGWSDKYNIRVEVGSLDLFPVGYCHASGHPLQVPPGYDSELDLNGNLMDTYSNSSTSSIISCSGGGTGGGTTTSTANPYGGCPTPGCKGYGNIKGPRYVSHQRLSGCPYADGNLKKDSIKAHERLNSTNIILTSNSSISMDSETIDSDSATTTTNTTTTITTTSSSISINTVSLQDPISGHQRLSPDSTVKSELSSSTSSASPSSASSSSSSSLNPIPTSVTCPCSEIKVSTSMCCTSVATLQLTNCNTNSNTTTSSDCCFSTVMNNPHLTSSSVVPAQTTITTTTPTTTTTMPPIILPSNELPQPQSSALPLNLTVDKLPDISELSNALSSPTDTATTTTTTVGVNNNSASKCENSNHSAEMSTNPTVLSNEQPSTNIIASITTKPDMEMVIDSIQPQKLSKMDTNTSLENISSSPPVNLLPQTTDQSDEYMKSLVSPVPPIKRKRGRPRKYASSGQVHHPSLQHSRHMHHFTSLGSTGRYSYVTSQYYTRSSSTVPMSTVSLTPALSLCSNMNMTVNSHQSIVDCQNVNSLLSHNLETNNNNNHNSKNIDVFRSATCSSEPSPSDSILTNACVSSSMNYMEVDRLKPPGYEIIGHSSSSIFPVMNDSTVGCSPNSAKLTQEITPVDLCSNPSPHLTVINSSPGMNCNPSNNNNNNFLPSQSMMMETSNPAWYPDAAINDRSFIPPMCHNPLLSSPFYIDPNRSACFLPIFEASASSSNYMNTPVNSLNSPSVRDVDLIMGRLLPQAGAAIHAAKVAGLSGPHSWNPNVVASFIATLPGCKQFACKFIENEIDGAALLCLEQHDLMNVLGMKLGPAVKVYTAIQTLRKSLLATPISELGAEHANAIAAVVSCFTNNNNTSLSSPQIGSGGAGAGVSLSVISDSQSVVNGSSVDTSLSNT
ncbi:unnamed protein product [Trichobilharzia szidati]|nr:unnamed protein product [Trichobilharzia szidati]